MSNIFCRIACRAGRVFFKWPLCLLLGSDQLTLCVSVTGWTILFKLFCGSAFAVSNCKLQTFDSKTTPEKNLNEIETICGTIYALGY